jgi:hypothetical protein
MPPFGVLIGSECLNGIEDPLEITFCVVLDLQSVYP